MIPLKRVTGVSLLVLLATAACAHSRDQRIAAAVRGALDKFDPARTTVIVAREPKDVPRVRKLAGDGRPVVARAQFVADHREGLIPSNILFESAELKGSAVHLRIHIPGVMPTPPEG